MSDKTTAVYETKKIAYSLKRGIAFTIVRYTDGTWVVETDGSTLMAQRADSGEYGAVMSPIRGTGQTSTEAYTNFLYEMTKFARIELDDERRAYRTSSTTGSSSTPIQGTQ